MNSGIECFSLQINNRYKRLFQIWAHFLLRKKPGFAGVPSRCMATIGGPAPGPLRAPPIPCAVAVSAAGGHGLPPSTPVVSIIPMIDTFAQILNKYLFGRSTLLSK
jgi:hypothetical protein